MPSIGGHLPGEKVAKDTSKTTLIPNGMEALSPFHKGGLGGF